MLPAMPRSLLRDDVYLRLRDAIVDGRLEPGRQLRDGELAEQLGVSRTPVREALLKLADSGLVEAQPGKSTVVTPLVDDHVRDARDVVAAMHEVAVRTAAELLTGTDLDTMRAANERFAAAMRAGDTEAALRADDEFHDVPVVAAANRAVRSVLDQFTPVVRRAERLRFSGLSGADSVRLHLALIAHLEAGDADAAAQVAFETWHSLDTEEPGPTNYLDRRAD